MVSRQESGTLGELQRTRVGVGDDNDAPAYRLARTVGFEQVAIFADQLLEAQAAQLQEGGRSRLGDRFGQPADRVERWTDRPLSFGLPKHVQSHGAGNWDIADRRQRNRQRHGRQKLRAGASGHRGARQGSAKEIVAKLGHRQSSFYAILG